MLPKVLREEDVEREEKEQETSGTILTSRGSNTRLRLNKLVTKNYNVSLTDGTIMYHDVYNYDLNTRKGFYKVLQQGQGNF